MAENWRSWIQKFELYLIASGISDKAEKVRCATFLHVAGDDAIKVFNTMDFDDDVDDLEILKDKFRQYCEPRRNITYLRHVFFTRVQGKSESIDAYVTDLNNKAKDCEFGQLTDSLIRDRIVCGVINDSVRARLLREPDLSLDKAVDICRANEATQSHMKALHEETEVSVNKLGRVKLTRTPKDSVLDKSDCNKCGYKHEPRKCPAFGQTCKVCNKKNHFGRMCQTKKPKESYRKMERSVNKIDREESEMFIGALESKKRGKEKMSQTEKRSYHRYKREKMD